jgi:hypothetical protein
MSVSDGAAAPTGPVLCQGFLVKHGGFFVKKVTSISRNIPILIQSDYQYTSHIRKRDLNSSFQVQKRFFTLTGNVLTWEKRSGTSDATKEKGKVAITGETLVEVLDAGSNLFEFKLSKFRPIKSSKSSDKSYRLGATSGEERDMWVRKPF